MKNKFGDICKNCGSKNTSRGYTKTGMYVSYYNLICEDCGHVESCREQG